MIIGIIYFAFDKSPTWENPGAKEVEISQKWELPEILDEVSGIFLLENNRMACVQDEQGIIFIYDLNRSSIEREIKFAGNGDYEGITVAGTTAYILRSDGVIIEVVNFEEEPLTSVIHNIGLPAKYDFEGISHDPGNNRLLLAIKDKAGEEYKPVFAFDLSMKQLQEEPAYKIYFDDPVFDILESKKTERLIRPSEIKIHPVTGKIYILDAEIPKLLILDPSGKAESLHVFKKEQFAQPEGLAISEEGEIYISNESGKSPANILKIKLKN